MTILCEIFIETNCKTNEIKMQIKNTKTVFTLLIFVIKFDSIILPPAKVPPPTAPIKAYNTTKINLDFDEPYFSVTGISIETSDISNKNIIAKKKNSNGSFSVKLFFTIPLIKKMKT